MSKSIIKWTLMLLSLVETISTQTTSTVQSPTPSSEAITDNAVSGQQSADGTIEISTTSPAKAQQATYSAEQANKPPMIPGHPQGQSWNTSILCRHLANLTRNNPAALAENVVEEPIEAKCFPGFVCVNGVCTGGMSCKCYDGWAGLFCQAPCPTDCAPWGSCVTSTSNQAICVCNETSKYTPGEGCVEKPPDFFTTTTTAAPTTPANLRPQSERECFGAFTCVYGFCQFATLQCSCDPGWKGQLCNQPCELNCSGHGRCYENDEFVLHCICDPYYTGEMCEIPLRMNIATSVQNSSHAGNAQIDTSAWSNQNLGGTTKPKISTESVSTDGNYSSLANASGTRPLSERECQPGFVCKNGYCVKGQMSCACDRGWGGTFCNMTCPLNCGIHGTCEVSDGELPRCGCHVGYAGKICDQRKPERPTDIDPWKELDPEYGRLAPLAQRMCLPDFVCAFGSCNKRGKDNPECKCDPRFSGKFCQTPCPLLCGDRRHCQFIAVELPECVCDADFTGPNCTRTAEQDGDPMPVAAVSSLVAMAVLLLLVLLVVLPALLYKRRNITMMKLVYRLQKFEENDNKEYDAFVLYVSADLDRQFVIQTLVPKLEGRMCFTLYIHQLNPSVLPGSSTSNIVPDILHKSRRVILILSPSLVNADWDKTDLQTILHETMKEKQKVILIALGEILDVKNKIDDPLGGVLRSATLLKYSGKNSSQQEYDTFWHRLQLTMPKKRPNVLESGKRQSCLMSPSIASSLESSQDPKAPLEIRLFVNGHLNTQLLPRIVRVPASNLDSGDKGSALVCPTFDRFLGRDHGSHSDLQEDNIGAADAYHRLSHSEQSSSEDILDGTPNGGYTFSSNEALKNEPRNGHAPRLDRAFLSQDGSWATTVSEFHNGHEIPISMLANYADDEGFDRRLLV